MFVESQHGVEGHTKDFRVFVEGDDGVRSQDLGMVVDLCCPGSEDGDGGLLWSNSHPDGLAPWSDVVNVSSQFVGRVRKWWRSRVEKCQVVSVCRGLCVWVVWAVCNIEVVKDRRDHRALRHSEEYLFGLGEVGIVGAAGRAPAEVGGEPTYYVAVEFGVCQFVDEFVVRDAVEGFGEIHCNCGRSGRGFWLIEAFGYTCNQREQCRRRGVGALEAVLGCARRKRFLKVRKEEALKHFDAWAEE